ncbi:D-Ala-D-Ala carboxypeptidase family metallohydrolase [Tautonia rosea]|uniref:D-Ala-D-Ala carboxypeptidase family metallohydrolase n=1 Tax=Tautonia rosea TaxID=2728037 RepID=UPI001474419C|nr:D-Ala-D-Ala carboxypeptidase family metallohydrolase [Tautonia rosea]
MASLTTIDFEGLAYNTADAVVDDQFRALGADFNRTAEVLRLPETLSPLYPPRSGSQVIQGGAAAIQIDAVGLTWSRVGGYVTGNENVTMTAYNSDGAVLGRSTTGGANYVGVGTPNHQLEVAAPGIAWVQIMPSGAFVLDDFYFETEPFEISYLSTNTFIATDEIILHAKVEGARAGTQVLWSVQGMDAAANVGGFPTNVVTTADADGVARFGFTPATNQSLVNDRRTNWTRGSRRANPPMSFEVTAKLTIDGSDFAETSLSDANLGALTQDETDRLRQEYFDYNIPVPRRSEVVASLGPGFNRGNYGVQLSVGLDTRYRAILAAYRGRPVTVNINGQSYRTAIPASAPVTISSGYRNPQRNRAIGSRYPDSKHTRGRALDLVPSLVQVVVLVNGSPMRVTLPLHQVLYPALYAAASSQGTAIAEQGARPVPVGDPRENHIHVQW